MPYQLQQSVCVVETVGRNPTLREAQIVKMGRKWATLSDNAGRFDVLTGDLDGGKYSSPGRVYPSRAVYEQEKALQEAWNKLQDRVYRSYHPPKSLTLEDIQQFLLRLG